MAIDSFSCQEVVGHLQSSLSDYLRDLEQLTSIDSGTHNKAGVDEMARWLDRRMADWGWSAHVHPQEFVGDCVHGTLNGTGRAKILLLGHLDTVYADGTANRRPTRIDGNRLYAPGAADMKGGLLCGLYALRNLQTQNFANFAEITLYCTSDEEDGSPMGAGLIRELAGGYDAVLVLEAAREDGCLVTARKGGGRFTLSVFGRSAHAGTEPEKGANAIVELAHQIIAATQLDGTIPGATVNVDVVRGGEKFNVIPDFAEALIDVRAVDPGSLKAVAESLKRQAARVTIPNTRAELEGDLRPAMPATGGNTLLLEFAQSVARELQFEVSAAPISGGTSDANFVAEVGIPVLDGLGPIGGNDHSPDEYIRIDSIVPRTALLAGLVARCCDNDIRLRAAGGGV